MIASYHCANGDCPELVEEAMVMLTDDLNHDAATVECFVSTANKFLKGKRGIQIIKEVQFSDGCASQYKNKTTFNHASESIDAYGLPVENN
jgi:hypothetical protein